MHEPSKRIKLYSNRFVSGRGSVDQMRAVLEQWRRSVDRRLARKGCTAYFQVDPWLFGFTGLLEQVFGEPTVIHLARHPFSCITSYLNRLHRTPAITLLKRCIPYWLLRGDVAGDYSRGEWRRLSKEEQVAWYWVKCNAHVDSQAEKLTRFTRIKYETLFDEAGRGLEELTALCGGEPLPVRERNADLFRNITPSKFEAATEWPDDVYRKVLNMCRPLMLKYGYTEDA